MANSTRYPTVTPSVDSRAWRITSFQLDAYDLEVIREPTWPFTDEPWATAFRLSREGRFVPRRLRDPKSTGHRPVTISRNTLPRLREDLLATDATKVESVRLFLERWGLLGLSEGYADSVRSFERGLGTDDVAMSREWLDRIQRSLYEPAETLRKFYGLLTKAGRLVEPWGTFRLVISKSGKAEPRVEVIGLLDALLMALPVWAEELPPRACANERCNGGVPRVITTPEPSQVYCSSRCATADRVRRFKRKQRALRRVMSGERVSAVAKRFRLNPEQVRRWIRDTSRPKRRGRKQ